jgi:ABC-type branched-subunit amino acid transport system substrate-binding protein
MHQSKMKKIIKQTPIMRLKNHILRGVFFLLTLSLTTTSCDLFRKAETSNVPKKPVPKDDDIKKPQGTVLVDTIRWKTDPKAKPPITTSGQPSNGTTGTNDPNYNPNYNPNNPNSGTGIPVPAKAYSMAVLLPFNTAQFTEGSNPPKAQFALDFYAGVKLALDSFSNYSSNLTVNVLDSKGDFNSVATRYEVSKADMILGPIDRNEVISAMAFSTRNKIPVVSPYFPTGDVESGNPYFIQVKPSLKTHCSNIIGHIVSHFPNSQVVIAARSKENETSRFAYFAEANKQYSAAQFEEWRIENELAMNPEPYIDQSRTTVFVIPSWNEAFVASFLKKLNASPRKGQVVVYGMPQWQDFTSLNGLYDALKVHISSSTYMDANAPDVRHFRSKFMSKYGKLPSSDSFLGFDCALYFGKMLLQYGNAFPEFLNREQQSVLHTRFYFNPVYRNVPVGDDVGGNISKSENGYVNILRYQGGNFRFAE